jgi:serine/threonine protein kinase/tetratricopeptide (TPR) repeat protein
MGEVYKALDTRLDRTVAIKVLPAKVADDPQFRDRFEREAKAVAALTHPHICTLHDVGETSDGHPFLVMELLQGETVQQRLARGPLEATLVVDLGIALADGLDAAHRAGIVHRDIKPANIFLTAHGPKILDFGLAKAASLPAAAASMQSTMAKSPLVTEPGSTVGTVAYMSPEQLRGEELDERTDLFSLGLVLYEMATGRPAFAGATSAMISAAILHTTPLPPRSVRPDLPAGLEGVILKAIEKDRHLRWQHASDIRVDLQRLKGDTSPVAVSRRPNPLLKYAVAAVAVLILTAGGLFYSQRTSAKPLTDKDVLVLADFTNTTGDSVFDETLRQGLAIQLGQSPFLSVAADDRIRRALQQMGQPPTARLTDEVARDICVRTGSTAVVNGSITSLGSAYVLGLRAVNCATGDLIDQEQLQAARKEDVLNGLSQLATKFRTRVGESLATVQRHSTPLEESTTPSLDALKAYSAAFNAATPSTAVPLLKRAIDIDPNFAIAYALLGLQYSGLGETLLGEEATSKAYQLRDHATDRDRFFIATIYDRQVTGNLEKEGETLRLWAQTYPRDPVAPGLMSGYATAGTGKYDSMIENARSAIAISPDSGTVTPAYFSVVWGYISQGRLMEADQALRQAVARAADFPDGAADAYHIAFLKGDIAEMERQAMLAKGKPQIEDSISHLQALALARAGRLDAARQSARHAIELTVAGGRSERAAVFEIGAGVWEALYGDAAAAKRSATHVLEAAKGRHVTYAAALALAIAGERSRAETIADGLERRFPEDTSVRFAYLPTLRALAALSANDPSHAIELLRPAATYEFAQPGITFSGAGGGSFGAMYPTYLRGQAYLALHKGAEAAAEFQKILDHPGVVLEDPIGALARLQLARAWTLAGDKVKAKAAYQDFLALWKDADADIPILRQAKGEYSKLG